MVHIYEKAGKFNDSEMLEAFPTLVIPPHFTSKFRLMRYKFSFMW